MRKSYPEAACAATRRAWRICLLGLMAAVVAGCGGAPSSTDGIGINNIVLPTDTLLNFACADVGIAGETCVLDDPENPFLSVAITEFDINNPDAENKFELNNAIPVGATGAKARFYLWATALARRPSGENQYYTARALHELFDAAGDQLVQEQALKAYRSVLDNFFGSVTFFECCGGVAFPATLNELVADILYRPESTGFEPLIPGVPLDVLSVFGDWGYTYRPATPPDFADGLVFLNQ
jgi:hypothetical protein